MQNRGLDTVSIGCQYNIAIFTLPDSSSPGGLGLLGLVPGLVVPVVWSSQVIISRRPGLVVFFLCFFASLLLLLLLLPLMPVEIKMMMIITFPP